MAFKYRTKAGKDTVALSITGIEFVVQTMKNNNAEANRERFLKLIDV